MGSFRHNLSGLLRFSGRSSLGQFWPYALAVLTLSFFVMAQVMGVVLADAMRRMQRFAREHPELATETRGSGHYSIQIEGFHPDLFPDLRPMMIYLGLIALVTVALLAASVTRRLHDRNWRGAWGLLPLPFLAIGLVMMPHMLNGRSPDMTLFFMLFFNNMLYLALLLWLIVLLALPGTPGANRFGQPPE